MTTMAYIIAGVCVVLTIVGIVWYWWLVRKGDSETSENAETMNSSDKKEEGK